MSIRDRSVIYLIAIDFPILIDNHEGMIRSGRLIPAQNGTER